jgi:flagellum-specific peptidoglycan hydrolase FlgJ
MALRDWIISIAVFLVSGLLFFRARIMTRKEFKTKFLKEIEKLDLKGFNPLLLLSLASYESGDGGGLMAKNTNNIFSLTAGKSWKGATYKASTGYIFRKYSNWRESTKDFINLLVGWPSNIGYASATRAAIEGNVENFAKGLQAGGYGDPGKESYAAELMARYKSFI